MQLGSRIPMAMDRALTDISRNCCGAHQQEGITYVELPSGLDASALKLPFYLAMEEYLAREADGEYFFMWQVDPTVIFGRNQVPQCELDLDFCRGNAIEFYRRKSGGGCVFADRNNVMFSFISLPSAEVMTTFAQFTGSVARMLSKLGLDASATGRNDILIGDRKVSGYAYYNINLPDGRRRAIVHGTMLYDADAALMSRVLTPSAAKMKARGVESVRSRVTTVREHLPSLGLEEFKRFAREHIASRTVGLTPAQVEEIRRIEQTYYPDSWIFGRHSNAGGERVRIEGVGEFDLRVSLTPESEPKRIASVELTGDFFLTGDLSELLTPLEGVELSRSAILAALQSVNTSEIIPGLTADALTDLIINNENA